MTGTTYFASGSGIPSDVTLMHGSTVKAEYKRLARLAGKLNDRAAGNLAVLRAESERRGYAL